MPTSVRIALILVGVGAIVLARALDRRTARPVRFALGLWSALHLGFLAFLFVNHAAFPAHLDLMEGTVLQHVRQAAAFEPVYPAPTPDYVPLAYNPLYYVLCAPFTWVCGSSLAVLRAVSIVGTLLAGAVLGRVVFERTRRRWWTLVAVGLFASAYRVMDAYLDTAHADSWLLACLFLGCWAIERRRETLGALALVAAFWFKQHGALFAVGGLLFLLVHRGWRRSALPWLLAVGLGPVAYFWFGPRLFGPWFHTFTWEVPRQWSQFGAWSVERPARFVVDFLPVLFAGAVFLAWRRRSEADPWTWMLPFVALSAWMGSLDPDSSNNVYIPLVAWSILLGTLGLRELERAGAFARRWAVGSMGVFASFALFSYLPGPVVCSPRAQASYDDLVAFLGALEGEVYAPSLGQLERGYALHPAAHWVALEDMIRGPGRDVRNHPNTRALLRPLLESEGPSFVLTNHPLHEIPCLNFLGDSHTLVADLGDRFEPLRVLPARWDQGWPRFLYRSGAVLPPDPQPTWVIPATRTAL